MRKESDSTEARRQYLAAYAAHYTRRDLPLAFQLYKELLASHPDDPEADYCQMQIQNIINDVVPRQDLLDAQMELAAARFGH